jgi:hypothetical protein
MYIPSQQTNVGFLLCTLLVQLWNMVLTNVGVLILLYYVNQHRAQVEPTLLLSQRCVMCQWIINKRYISGLHLNHCVIMCGGRWFWIYYVISAYHHRCYEFESRSGRGVQHYVIKLVSDLQVDGFPPVSSTNKNWYLAPLSTIFWLYRGGQFYMKTEKNHRPVAIHWQTIT